MTTDDGPALLSALVIAARAGDQAAWAELVARFWGMALRVARGQLGSRAGAEDVVQEAFVGAFQHLGELHDPPAFTAWFERILHTHCDRVTRKPGRQALLAAAGVETILGLSDGSGLEAANTAVGLLQGLPVSQRVVLCLYAMGYSQNEVAAIVGVPLTTVKKRLHDARQRLRRERQARFARIVREEPGSHRPGIASWAHALRNELDCLPAGEIAARVTTIPVGRHPGGVGLDFATDRAFVVNSAVGTPAGSVSVIDGSRLQVIAVAPTLRQPRCIAVDPQRERLYLTHYFGRTVVVLDTESLHPLASVALAGNPVGIDLHPDTGRVYVATMADGDQGGAFAGVEVIDPATNHVCAAVPVGHQTPSASGPVCVRVNPLVDQVYVSGCHPGAVTVIEAAANAVVADCALNQVHALAVDPPAHRVYAASYADGVLAVLDADTATVLATVPELDNVAGLEVDPVAGRLYLSQPGAVRVLSTVTLQTLCLVPLGSSSCLTTGSLGGLCLNPLTQQLYCSQQQADVVYVLDQWVR
ncbi:MAG: sigma-70 family RNA polymerase sigma factor [Candidatus Latescibacterota bacterium]